MSNSYCKNVCNFDLQHYICTACGRTSAEVAEWFTASDERKKEIAKDARKRAKETREEEALIDSVPVPDGEWDWVLDAIDGKLNSK
jgi:predicted Fe-S protein YdhL (DUF1289 family)